MQNCGVIAPLIQLHSLFGFLLLRKLKLTSGTDLCVQQLLKEEDLGYDL